MTSKYKNAVTFTTNAVCVKAFLTFSKLSTSVTFSHSKSSGAHPVEMLTASF